mgnify:CR=1 FL=1
MNTDIIKGKLTEEKKAEIAETIEKHEAQIDSEARTARLVSQLDAAIGTPPPAGAVLLFFVVFDAGRPRRGCRGRGPARASGPARACW